MKTELDGYIGDTQVEKKRTDFATIFVERLKWLATATDEEVVEVNSKIARKRKCYA